jgi:RimJ/RimL family protein N-acetyltransferase
MDDNVIKISKITKTDLETLLKWAADEKTLLQWSGPYFSFPLTMKQLEDHFEATLSDIPKRFIFKVHQEDNIISIAELNNVDRINCSASLCRVFTSPEYRGKGVAKMLIKHILNFGFNELNLERIELIVYDFNLPAIKCYEDLGFVREGFLRKNTKYKNEYWNGYIYSLLKEEWKDN